MSTCLIRSRVSSEQLDLLLTFMEEHPDFAAGKQAIYSRYSSSKLWRLLAERLNAAAADTGGARKSPDKWSRYWVDIKYKARRKSAAGGALGDLSSAEERLQNIFNNSNCVSHTPRGGSHSDEDHKLTPLDDDMRSDTSVPSTSDAPRPSTEELLAEAAMRSALAAEKQAESVAQAVDLLRDIVTLLRERNHQQSQPPPQTHQEPTVQVYQHHHRL